MDEASTRPAAIPAASPHTQEQSASAPDQPNPRRPGRWRRRILIASLLVVVISAAIVLPPMVNISRYQRQITAIMASSLGRPVHLSGVELRLLPLPGFVLHDLSVSEDPSFGNEPILSAHTVVATVRILSLWKGKIEISRITVDEASLNLVRSPRGTWNLESLMMGASQPGSAGAFRAPSPSDVKRHPFPYLEATNSRINLKNGAEKSPFSVIDADLSLWLDDPGEWRIRLRGQPVRTDIEMSLADTGEVRLEGSLHSAAELREMPLKLQMEWRDGQLGQLSRLLSGSDAGWRGAVTADINVQGTTEAAQITARLQATSVGREEFTPATPIDLDANCHLLYEHSQNAIHKLGCDTAIGDGHLRLAADLPGNTPGNASGSKPDGQLTNQLDAGSQPEASLEVKQIPLQAALDLLRTVRRGFAPEIEADGFLNGELTYKPVSETPAAATRASHTISRRKQARPATPALTALQGSLTLDGARLQGGKLKEPLILPKMTLVPTGISDLGGSKTAISGEVSVSLAAHSGKAGASADAIRIRLGVTTSGYAIAIGGSATPTQLRDLSYAFGLPHSDVVDGFGSGTADLDLAVSGPWIPLKPVFNPDSTLDSNHESAPAAKQTLVPVHTSPAPNPIAPVAANNSDQLSGSILLHHTQWRAAYLARPVELPQAAIALSPGNIGVTSDFTYRANLSGANSAGANQAGANPALSLQGSLALRLPTNCTTGDCKPQLQLHFGALDAFTIQKALLGTPAEKSLLSPLIDRMHSDQKSAWPSLSVSIQADSLLLGALAVHKPILQLQVNDDDIDVSHWEAEILGGSGSGTAHFQLSDNKPQYTLEGNFARVNPAALGAFFANHWAGGAIEGSSKLEFSGLTDKDISASAKGTAQFQWKSGTLTPGPAAQPLHFDDWTGELKIADGKAQLEKNELLSAHRSSTVTGSFPITGPVVGSITGPVKLTVTPSSAPAKKHAR
ncbi:AsmA family protein [Acidicapsa ligni]|uniref:AsmA family protein n=1 Tax=Acidicapsa ligni TaxID=542300 RepID=UPI0021E01E0A|nr:AsmA family protein [Acidicapsa ligni]